MVTTRVTSVGKYRLTGLIGEGGMGSVHLAIDTVLERQVAVKILHSHLCRSTEMRERFRNEAKTHGKLEHPNIVRVYDFLISDDLLLIAMEYVPGGRNLGDLIKGRPLPQRVACDVLRQVLRGVSHAHGEGVVHRDIKPPNILIGEERGQIRPRLTDFGIAKALHTTSMTQPGSVLGTVDYMSPEQCLGRPVDTRSDLYSLGVVFYECLTGRVPFQASTEYQVMQAHVDNAPARPDRYNPDLLPGLVAICLRALEKDPERRYASANAILDDLDALAQDLDRLPDEQLVLPPPRVTLGGADDADGPGADNGAPLPEAPTAFAGVPSGSGPVPDASGGSVDAVASAPDGVPRRPSTRSLDGPVTTSAAPEEAEPPGRKHRAATWAVLVLLLLAGGAAAAYWFHFREAPASAERPAAAPRAAPDTAQQARELLAGGKFAEALERVLPRLAVERGPTDATDVALLADVLVQSATVLSPERRAAAAQALEALLRRTPAPPAAAIDAALRGATALAAAGDVGHATTIVAAAAALPADPARATAAFGALAAAIEHGGGFDEAFAVVTLLSGIPPDSPLYEPARRTLGTAQEALLVRERVAGEDALRAGRWTDARIALDRVQNELGDARESTRQLELKAKDLEHAGTGGACAPVGLVRLRDPDAVSRALGRPQLAWTGEDYLVVWSDGRAAAQGSTAQHIYLQRLDPSGRRLIAKDQVVSAPDADAGWPTIDCLDKQCGIAWTEQSGAERRVMFRAVDFLGNPSGDASTLATGVIPAAYPAVAAARAGSSVAFAVSWSGREVVDARRGVVRDGAAVAFLDRTGQVVDGPRFPRAPPSADSGPPRRGARARPDVTRQPHVAGLRDAGFAVAWEQEGEGRVVIVLAAFPAVGGEPVWMHRILPDDVPAHAVEGRLPFLAVHPDSGRIATVWLNHTAGTDELVVSLFDATGNPVGSSVAARGAIRYQGGLFVGDRLVVTSWVRSAARLDLALCPLAGGCPAPPDTVDPAAGIPVASLGGRAGLAPGVARDELAAVWREHPGSAAADDNDDANSVGDEIFFVRLHCGGS